MARVPIYRVIADDLLAQITGGELPVSSQLPSEAEPSAVDRNGLSSKITGALPPSWR
jgi:hypothetical protein